MDSKILDTFNVIGFEIIFGWIVDVDDVCVGGADSIIM